MATNTKLNDTFCNRIIYNTSFSPKDDMYISFRLAFDYNALVDEQNQFQILSEEGQVFYLENFFDARTGFMIFLVDGSYPIDEINGEPGIGYCLAATLSSAFTEVSRHIMSLAFDINGLYGQNDTFKNSNSSGTTTPVQKSVTIRQKTLQSDYMFVTSKSIDTFFEDITQTESTYVDVRIRFKDFLNTIYVDLRLPDELDYKNVFKERTGFNINILPTRVKPGLSYSGNLPLFIRDLTYSGTTI
jgi:hypothetical protein